MHGYSGRWQVEATYEVYRHIQINDPDFAVFSGSMILQILSDGNGGAGFAYGNLQIQVGNCYAKFEGSDRVIDARVFSDGSIKIRNAMEIRHPIKLEGEPPQRDGFEPDYRGAREMDLFFRCPPEEPGVLRVQFSSEVGGNIYSKGTGKWSS